MMTSPTTHLSRGPRWSTRAGTLAVLALGALGPTLAHAHFVQQQPPSWSIQDGLGSPQKSAPCGQADPGNAVQPTNIVTNYIQGQMITLTINETVAHPGHYRVSIAANQNALPADPPVTAGATPCGSTTIAANPTLPLIADGVFVHTAAFNAPQTTQIQLPPNFTCINCTLQVTEFMSNHALNNPGGCFYHHCANVSIYPTGTDLGAAVVDAGVPDASTGNNPADLATTTTTPPPPSTTATGCGYYLGAAAAPAALYLAGPFVLGLFIRRRRRTSPA